MATSRGEAAAATLDLLVATSRGGAAAATLDIPGGKSRQRRVGTRKRCKNHLCGLRLAEPGRRRYRTPLVFGYCLYAARIGFTWQPAVGALCGCVLAHLDYEWTRAMLPKAEPGYFRPVAGGAAAFGLSAAVLALLTDALPGLLETYEGLVFPGPVRAPVRTCLAAEGYF